MRARYAGSTTHVLDLQSGRVVRHIEAWDVEPSKVVRLLFKPASKVRRLAMPAGYAVDGLKVKVNKMAGLDDEHDGLQARQRWWRCLYAVCMLH
jgi:hypothetical protein